MNHSEKVVLTRTGFDSLSSVFISFYVFHLDVSAYLCCVCHLKIAIMALSQTRGDPTIHQVEWFELFGRLGVTAIGYPIEYVKVLIQV